MEEFRDILGYEGLYQVSNLGRIRSLSRLVKHSSGSLRRIKERLLKYNINTRGYYTVNLNREGSYTTRTVHQLVAIAFLDHKPCGYDVVIDHLDNNPLNNNVNNLRLTSNRENSSKDRKVGTSSYTGVAFHKHNKKWYSCIRINGKRKYLGYFKTEIEASNAYQLKLKEVS